jgi:Mrp family chromosome partitioning ATPase
VLRQRETDGAFDVAAALRRVLDKAEGVFDVALVDAPAVLDRADAVGAVAVVPDVVLVVEAGRTPRAAIERARTELARESARVVGSILTKHKRFIPQWLYDLLARP